MNEKHTPDIEDFIQKNVKYFIKNIYIDHILK
jgi:hypothetical protein